MKSAQSLFLLVLLGFTLLLPGNNVIPLIDRDEPRFAQATVEMMQRREWVIPYFNGEFRFDKPVLTYWLMRGAYAVFGVGEFGARFHSAVCAIGVALLVFAMGRRWFSPAAGLAAAIGWLTCAQVQIHGRAAVADMPMVLFVTASLWAIFELLTAEGPPARRWFWLLYASLGLGFLAKGPIAWLVPLLTVLLWRFALWRRPAPWRNLKLAQGLPVALFLLGAWGIPALLQTHGAFWQKGINEHVIERGMKSFNSRMFLPVYYPLTALASLFPWSLLLASAWKTARHSRTASGTFLSAWFLSPFLIFTFYATQLPHYILPGFPAFFLLLGPAWDRWRRWRYALAALVLLVVAGIQVAGVWLRRETPAVRMQTSLRAMPADAEFGFYRYQEPSLVFYSGRRWETLHNLDDVRDFLARPGPRVMVALESDRKKNYRAEYEGLDTAGFEVDRSSGWNVARSQPVTLRVYTRR